MDIKLIALLLLSTLILGLSSDQLALPGCPDHCGDLVIPYPFGIQNDCFLSDRFFIQCNTSFDPPLAYLHESDIIITDISIHGELHILQLTAQDCYNTSGDQFGNNEINLEFESFTISSTKNKFVALGCDTIAMLEGNQNGRSYRTGCLSVCDNTSYVQNGSCVGVGCCQIEIPNALQHVEMLVTSLENHSSTMEFNPCGYAAFVEQSWFNFSSEYLREFPEKVPLMVDWAVGKDTCVNAENKTRCSCGENSNLVHSLRNDSEYLCKCWDGYQGNPYLMNGCQDINECEDQKLHNCTVSSYCVNTNGSYTCPCQKGFNKIVGNCIKKETVIQFTIGIAIGVLLLLILCSWSCLGYRKWKYIKSKQRFFKKNGGLMLQRKLSGRESNDTAKIFTEEELKRATNNYDESRIVGRGGFGIVFKGVLADGLVVAIKKSKIVDQNQIEQFVNEVLVLSKINHRNVVRLLGCCLETEVPLLVYEFVTNGTLFDHIHKKTKALPIPWEIRLRIAAESAGVLSYLHSSASVPIIHRDVKSTNILLDDLYTAKVSDFGASRLIPLDETQLTTMVQGTLGYLDPEYFQTSQLNEKSDVYSFGVVLVELLTGRKALRFDGPEEERSLAMHFLIALEEDRLVQILEDCVVKDAKDIDKVKEVANVAKRCLRLRGQERPSMKEVAMELEALRITTKTFMG